MFARECAKDKYREFTSVPYDCDSFAEVDMNLYQSHPSKLSIYWESGPLELQAVCLVASDKYFQFKASRRYSNKPLHFIQTISNPIAMTRRKRNRGGASSWEVKLDWSIEAHGQNNDSPSSSDPPGLGLFDCQLPVGATEERRPPPKALKNQDILNLIFTHFDLQPGSQTVAQSRKDLLSAAKTCKAFVEPALNYLWRVLPSLLPILLLLPTAEVYNGHYFVDELPLADDPIQQSVGWERLDAHARRVRILYTEPVRATISPNIYLRIGTRRKGPLLPGLKKIYILDHPSIDISSALFLASGSTLNTVQLDSNMISDRQFFVPFLSSLHVQSPGLTHLALCGIVNTSLEPIYRFTQLQRLELRFCNLCLHPQLLQRLGQLRHLLYLLIDTGSSKDVTTLFQFHSKFPFSLDPKFEQLRQLHILGTAASMGHVLDEMKGLSNLTVLKIDAFWDGRADSSTDSSWKSTFKAMSTFSAVEDIEISLVHNGPPDQYIISASSLAPLYRLDKMKSFVINSNNAAFSGTDEDFRQLAGAFPKLEKVAVPPPSRFLTIAGTLACLYHFSCKCPDLREIKIGPSFNISENLTAIENLMAHPISRNHLHPLKKLYIDSDFGPLKPTHLIQVAQFLDLIFPNLTTLETDNTKTTEVESWAGIYEFRLALQKARMNP